MLCTSNHSSFVESNGIGCPSSDEKKKKQWCIKVSQESKGSDVAATKRILKLKVTCNPNLDLIRLSIGDPTVYGNFSPPSSTVEAVLRQLGEGNQSHGKGPPCGLVSACQAVADHYSTLGEEVSPEAVAITTGCIGAVELAIASLAGPGDNVLLPVPGFSGYNITIEGLGVEYKQYKLLPEEDWQADLQHLESLIDSHTKLIVIINPSNPCGSVYSQQHIRALTDIAARHHLPVIADEIYMGVQYGEEQFHAVHITNRDIPVILCGGIAKRYMVPGWRLGWLVVFDRHNYFRSSGVVDAIRLLAERVGSTATFVQAALGSILRDTPPEYHEGNIQRLSEGAQLLLDKLSLVEGLSPVNPQGAMYIMVGIEVSKFKDIADDLEFTAKLLAEKSVFVLPGQAFFVVNFVRMTLTIPRDLITTACDRIAQFCSEHRK